MTTPNPSLDEGGEIEVMFDEPVRAVTSGQSIVIYDGEEMIGGGIIA
jgi:tRNA-specific 2-thiouridylase